MKQPVAAFFLAAVTLISACGKQESARPPVPARTQSKVAPRPGVRSGTPRVFTPSSSPAPVAPFRLSGNFYGKNLTLVYPHSANFGWISLDGADAKALFHALAVKTTETGGNLVWLPAKTRQGRDVVCFEQARKSAPQDLRYGCSMYIDYRIGWVRGQGAEQAEPGVLPLAKGYFGQNLTLIASPAVSSGFINLQGEDARALYDTLLAVPTRRAPGEPIWRSSFRKTGLSLSCDEMEKTSAPGMPLYWCTVFLDYRTGAVSAANQ